jgi:hypothetical protein
MKTRPSKQDRDTCLNLAIFKRYFTVQKDGQLDASQVLGKECFEEWKAQHPRIKAPVRTFQRYIIAHITGTSGRQPFNPKEEMALITILRHHKTWGAFSGTRIGRGGFRRWGYHELKQHNQGITLNIDHDAVITCPVSNAVIPCWVFDLFMTHFRIY